MDADGLPLVGPGIDFTKVGAIHPKRTLAFLNHFISHTVQFLNDFSCVCEEKLERLTVRLQRLETTMNILEAKLASIPGLENVTVPVSSNVTTEVQKPEQTTVTVTEAPPQTSQPEQQIQPEPQEKQPEPEVKTTTVAQDPRYAKYFKMISMGVPLGALRGRVLQDGLNPDLLETPDAPMPSDGQATSTNKTNDSDTDFSDDKGEESSDDSSGFSD